MFHGASISVHNLVHGKYKMSVFKDVSTISLGLACSRGYALSISDISSDLSNSPVLWGHDVFKNFHVGVAFSKYRPQVSPSVCQESLTSSLFYLVTNPLILKILPLLFTGGIFSPGCVIGTAGKDRAGGKALVDRKNLKTYLFQVRQHQHESIYAQLTCQFSSPMIVIIAAPEGGVTEQDCNSEWSTNCWTWSLPLKPWFHLKCLLKTEYSGQDELLKFGFAKRWHLGADFIT